MDQRPETTSPAGQCHQRTRGYEPSGRRSLGGTSSDWYQLFVLSNPVELGPQTVVGNGPFDVDVDGRQRCPLGLRDHVLGLNLLSQASILSPQWSGSDFVRSRGLVECAVAFLCHALLFSFPHGYVSCL